jgi:DNA-binding NarL/FixJ family response regulator
VSSDILGPGDSALRVVLGEDDVLMREGIARLLTEAGLEVVAQAADADDLIRKVLAHQPDVAIVDIQMPPLYHGDGLTAAIELRRQLPDCGVLILSAFCDATYAAALIGDRPDGVGYLLKERVGDLATFVDAVARVGSGGSALDPEVVARILGRHRRDDPLDRLTDRERAVLTVMAEGRSNSGIAEALSVSEAAVEKHITAIFRKLELGVEDTEHRRVRAVLTYIGARGRHVRSRYEQH